MIHEDFHARIIREVISTLRHHRIRGTGVHLALQNTFLPAALPSLDNQRTRETVFFDNLNVFFRLFEQVSEMLIIRLFMIPQFFPLMNLLSVPNHDLEIRVQEQYHVAFERFDIQRDWSRLALVETVL
jgi:hypothetical protein